MYKYGILLGISILKYFPIDIIKNQHKFNEQLTVYLLSTICLLYDKIAKKMITTANVALVCLALEIGLHTA